MNINVYQAKYDEETILLAQPDGRLVPLSNDMQYQCPETLYAFAAADDYNGDTAAADVGIFLGYLTEDSFVEVTEEVEDMSFQDLYDSLSEGQKIHMANKLWKDDGICASKLRQYLPAQLEYDLGDVVEVVCETTDSALRIGQFGRIVRLDPDCDRGYVYRVAVSADAEHWATANQLEKI